MESSHNQGATCKLAAGSAGDGIAAPWPGERAFSKRLQLQMNPGGADGAVLSCLICVHPHAFTVAHCHQAAAVCGAKLISVVATWQIAAATNSAAVTLWLPGGSRRVPAGKRGDVAGAGRGDLANRSHRNF
jgi:hypothetical protein